MKMGSTEQRGDTIIEVLISIAVASLVLASAYAISNRNLVTTQDTQEHSQALQIVQQQIEGLRALAATPGVTLVTTFPPSQCVDLSGTPVASTTACQITSASSSCVPATASAACYKIAITQLLSDVYHVAVTWPSVNGNTASVSMDYGI